MSLFKCKFFFPVRARRSASSKLFGKSALITAGRKKIRLTESRASRAKAGVFVPITVKINGAHVELKLPKALKR